MKKLLSLFIFLSLVLRTSAQEEIDGIFYNLDVNNKTAEIVENIDYYAGEVNVPESVTLNNETYTVTRIADFAFYDCGSLTKVTLPETIEYIGMYSFQNCYKLKSINIPQNVNVIGEQAFGECTSVIEINVPGNISELGVSAFEGCTALTKVTIGEGLTTIPSTVFARCESLAEVTIPSTVDVIADWAFTNCISLKKVNFNEGLTAIDEAAFAFCTSLESVTLPSTLKTIGDDVFNHCINMAYIDMPEGLESIGNYILDNCEMLGYIRCRSAKPAKVFLDKILDYCDQTILYVPFGAKDAYANAEGWNNFNNCIEIGDEETITYSLKRIETDNMSFIASPLDSRIAKVVSKKDNEKYIGDVIIPSEITDADGTVYTVNHIGEGAFELSNEMTYVSIPSSVTSIGEWAFSGAQVLPAVDIPTSVTKIGNAAFFGCASLANITLHNTLEYIGEDAFSGCFTLLNIYSEIEDPFLIPEHAFDFIEEQTLHVPYGTKEIYKSTDYWWRFSNIEEDENVNSIDNVTVDTDEDNRIFDLQGRRVISPMKGIYIHNGKKIIY